MFSFAGLNFLYFSSGILGAGSACWIRIASTVAGANSLGSRPSHFKWGFGVAHELVRILFPLFHGAQRKEGLKSERPIRVEGLISQKGLQVLDL